MQLNEIRKARGLDELVQQLLDMAAKGEDKDDPQPLGYFKVERQAKTLISPANKRAKHHRQREKHYTAELEKAERELRRKGISVEAYDPYSGVSVARMGAVASGNISNLATTFQPKIDEKLLDAVKHAKEKMLEHRGKAERYEKYARAFACSPNSKIELTVEEVDFFKLEK